MNFQNYIKNIGFLFVAIAIILGCQDMDEPALGEYPLDGPVITIVSPNPLGTTQIQTLEDVASVSISFTATDDVGVANVSVLYDGSEIANYSNFEDPQNVVIDDLTYDQVTNGTHTITINAVDTDGNESSTGTDFTKIAAEPFNPLFGETFYMPFNDNFYDVISINPATEVGTPGFAGESYQGSNAFKAGTDNYLTFPATGHMTNEFSATFWYKVDSNPDRAGIFTIGNEDQPESRNYGLRIFREGDANNQRIKLNVGTGSGESWNDGGVLNVADGEWVNIAISISETQSVIYFNGQEVNTANLSAPIDWTGCSQFTIGAGGTTFSYWNHLSDSSAMDELKLYDRALNQTEVNEIAGIVFYPDQTAYFPFNGNYEENLTENTATVVGTPGFAGESQSGSDAFQSAADSYLTYPIDGLFTNEFTATFWYKANGNPDRAGILVVGNDTPENRSQGFRIFREGSATEQRIKLNLGVGTGESWNDGGVITVADGEWVHVAITVSATESKIYFDGEEVNSATYTTPVDFTGCTDMVIGNGGPTFSYWNHLYDSSYLDELRIFDVALTQEQIQEML